MSKQWNNSSAIRCINVSQAQKRIWFEWQLNPNSIAYNNPLLYQLSGALSRDYLINALQQIVIEQPAMRSYFIMQAGLPKQVIHSDIPTALDFYDVVDLGVGAQAEIDRIISENICKPFDLSTGPLFRFSLIQTAKNEHLLVLNIHHIVVDGYSAMLLIEKISKYYQRFFAQEQSALLHYDNDYCDYFEQNEGGDVANIESDEALFWQDMFTDAHINVDLLQNESSLVPSEEGHRYYFSIPKILSQKIKLLSREYKTTDFNILMAAFYVVLAKYSNQSDITIGYPLDVRPLECRDFFGFFVNNIPFRMQFHEEDTFRSFVTRINQYRKKIKMYQKTDLSQIIRFVRSTHPARPDKLYNVAFIRANFAIAGLVLPGITVVPKLVSTSAVKDDLCLLYDDHDTFEFAIEYNKNKFFHDYIEDIQISYVDYLQSIVLKEDQLLKKVSLFSKADQKFIPTPVVRLFPTLLQRFAAHAASAPNELAVVSDRITWTYEQLYHQVMRYCGALSQHKIAQKPMAVCLKRGPDLLAVLLALQYLEVPYIPIDPTMVVERLKTIIEDSQASALIHDGLEEVLLHAIPCQLLCIDVLKADMADDLSYVSVYKNSVAYIIYTSGSTGTPKGVAVGYDALNHFLETMSHYFLQESDAMLLAITTIGFDIAGLELFLPVWQKKPLVIASQERHKDPFALLQMLKTYPITCLQATPAMWQMLLEAGWSGKKNLTALCGGEKLTKHLAAQLLPKVRALWNMYGPTEATIWCALKRIDDPEHITVGLPIENMSMFILDSNDHLLPPYVKGELYITGIGLAKGYVNNELLTKQQFVKKAHITEALCYRTGDIAYTTRDGSFVIVGRTDHQIKLNGHRIELGDIESCLLKLENVSKSAALVYENQIIAYVTLEEHDTCSEEKIINDVAKLLPDYMVPKRCMILSHFPLNANGKVDKKALPRPIQVTEKLFEHPNTDLENSVLQIWQHFFNKEHISVTASFYEMGGHSLLAVQLAMALSKRFNTQLKLIDVLRHLTIRQQAFFLQDKRQYTLPLLSTTQLTIVPLTIAQKRIWFISKLYADNGQYNMAAKVSIDGAVDIRRLKEALEYVIKRQASLRIAINVIDYEPHQYIAAPACIEIEDMAENTPSSWIDWAMKPFQMYDKPLLRFCLYQEANDSSILGISIHHLIADGYSVTLFFKELWDAYDQKELAVPLLHHYIDYASFEQTQPELERDVLFWRHELLSCPYLQLPHDLNRADLLGVGDHYFAAVSSDLWAKTQVFCEKENISPTCVLIGAFGLLMNLYTHQSDFCIGIPIAKRDHPSLEHMIGCFMDLLPLRLRVAPHKTSSLEWLKFVETQLNNCLMHNSLSFFSILNHLHIERSGALSPLFPVVLNIQQDAFRQSYSEIVDIQIQPILGYTSKYDLSLEIYFSDQSLSCHWEYAIGLFEKATIEKMHHKFEAILQNLIDVTQGNYLTTYSGREIALSSDPMIFLQEDVPYRQPSSELQKKVADVWKRTLNQSQIGLDDHFFRLGGHSFLAVKMIGTLSNELNCTIPLELIFKYSKLIAFCEAILPEAPKQMKQFDPNHLPLTPNQRQIVWALKQGYQPVSAYQIGVLLEFEKMLDLNRLQDACRQTMARHSIYTWALKIGMEHAYLMSELNVLIDLQELGHQNLYEQALLQNNIDMDLMHAPLIRMVWWYDKRALLVSAHHLIADEWSLQLFLQEMLTIYYNDASCIPALLMPSCWEQQIDPWLHYHDVDLNYWEYYLRNSVQSDIVPTRVLSENSTEGYSSCKRHIEAKWIIRGREYAKQRDVTYYHLVLSLFVYLIANVTHADEVSFAVTHDRRRHQQQQALHGYLVNLSQVRLSRSDLTFLDDLLKLIKSYHIDSLEHGNIDYAFLMEKKWVAKPHIIFNFQHTHDINMGSEHIKWAPITNHHNKFSLVFNIRILSTSDMCVEIEYQRSKYHAQFIEHLMDAYSRYLQQFDDWAHQPMSNWFCDRYTIETGPAVGPKNELITSMRSDATVQMNIAVQYQDQRISYANFWRDIDGVSEHLLQLISDDMLPDRVIAVHLNNKYHYVVMVFAILQIGAAFLGLDPGLPSERKQYLLENSKAVWFIYDEKCPEFVNKTRYAVSFTDLYYAPVANQTVLRKIDPSSWAYLIYTSGTTGLPKAAIITRDALLSFVMALKAQLGICSSDNVLQFSSVSFDASIWEIFLAIYAGATLCIPDEKQRRVGKPLQAYMQSYEVSHAILTPTVLSTLYPEQLPSLRVVASGGEACNTNLIHIWSQYCDFYNAYGPSEATVCVLMQKCTPEIKASVIGSPLGEAMLWVATPALQQLPIGAIGELIIGGPILSMGYLNNQVLNDKHFVQINGKRWYRTGDCVRQIDTNQFEYLGRLDRQVKLRGIRIELQEIESMLMSMSEIYAASCHVEQEQLWAYITVRTIQSESEILAYLSKRMPHYMLPNRIIQLDSLPLLASGKIDISRLPKPDMTFNQLDVPKSDLEMRLHAIWSEVLAVPSIDVSQDFFALGGNSVQAMTIIVEIERHFSIELLMSVFYTHGSITSQAKLLASMQLSNETESTMQVED